MRHYDKGNTRAWVQHFREENAKKCLYLVPEPSNTHDKNAIMLHDGEKRVAYVQASEAPHLAEMLNGTEDVYCVYVTQVGHGASTYEPTFLRVKAFCKVDERLARKYTCEPTSKTTPSTHKKKVEAQKAATVEKLRAMKSNGLWVPRSKYETALGLDAYEGRYGFDDTY
jgi:hypothetical protein